MNPTITKSLFLTCVAFMLLTSGCDREEEAIPTYLEILPFQLTTDYTNEGSASEKVVDAWLYVGTEFLGAYELPATVPVLASGANEITLFPGIKVNGIASRPEINVFYERYVTNLDLQAGEISTIQPVTKYLEFAEFPFIENFDSAHVIDEDEDGNPNTAITVSTTEAFENASGHIHLDVDNIQMEAATSIRFENLPTNNSTVYLELDYKNNIAFAIGLIGHQANIPEAKQYIIVLNPKDEWNKIYIDLSGELAASGLNEYQLVFNAILPLNDAGGFDPEEGDIYLDNIKLVHFEQ